MSTFFLTALLAVNLCDARGPGGGGKGGGGGGGQSSSGGKGGGGNSGNGNSGGVHIGGQGQGGVHVPGTGQGQGGVHVQGGGQGQGQGHVPGQPHNGVLGTNGPHTPNANFPHNPNSPRMTLPGNNAPGTNALPGTNSGPRHFDPRSNSGNNSNLGNNNNDGRFNRFNGGPNPNRDGNANGNVNSGRGDGNGQRYAHQSFHSGHWNHPGSNNNFNNQNFNQNNNNNNNGYQGLRGYSRLYSGYGSSAYGYGNSGYGIGSSGGGSGLGSLLGIGMALAGYGNGFGLNGGGLGLGGGLGGYGQSYGQGGYGGYGLYGGYPIGWGLGGGGLAYNSGYLPYSNPYYASDMGGYNYAQPIPTAVVANENPTSSQLFDTALAQFKAGDYQGSLVSVDNAIQQNPSDPTMHEFRALNLFALKNYDSAAATIHSVLAVGPGWNWETVGNLYADTDVYESQLRSLEQETEAHQDQADTHFLLAYHYMVTGHPDAASRQLTRVVKSNPNDRLAADLLKMNDANSTAASSTGPTALAQATPAQPAPAPKAVDPTTLVGTWHASREDGSKFDLQLADDKTFTWKVQPKQGAEQTLKGTYEVQKDLLALESPDSGGMLAQVAQNDDGHFTFKMLGAPQDDKGLAFAK